MKILVAGSPTWDWMSVFNRTITDVIAELQYDNATRTKNIEKELEVVSTDGHGVAEMTKKFCGIHNIKNTIFKTDWTNMRDGFVSVGYSTAGTEYNKSAKFNRNKKIMEYLKQDPLSFGLFFYVSENIGTDDLIAKCKKQNVGSYIFTVQYGVQLKLEMFNLKSKYTGRYR